MRNTSIILLFIVLFFSVTSCFRKPDEDDLAKKGPVVVVPVDTTPPPPIDTFSSFKINGSTVKLDSAIGSLYTTSSFPPKRLIDVFAFDLNKGGRKKETASFQFVADSLGNWGPFVADPSIGYEFVLKPTGGQRTVYYYYEPFVQSNRLVYLRALPKTGMTALLLNTLPADDQQSVLAIFTSNGAVVNGRDSLTINDFNLSSSTISPASKTGIAQFIFDNGDKQSSGKLILNFNAVPFMNGIDLLLDTQNITPIHLYFNGRDLYLPKRKSATEGVMVMVLN
ncbi:MAG: hypothetical protein EAZ12_06525 [Sphingobacteriia bacterium]|nr:MAG: hypothetical protein EAZ12_06525 [Sphingobacteriia bacterium]